MIPLNVLYVAVFCVFLGQKSKIIKYIETDEKLVEEFFGDNLVEQLNQNKVNQVDIEQYIENMQNKTNENDSLTFSNFYGKGLIMIIIYRVCIN